MDMYAFCHNEERQCTEREEVLAVGELNAARYV